MKNIVLVGNVILKVKLAETTYHMNPHDISYQQSPLVQLALRLRQEKTEVHVVTRLGDDRISNRLHHILLDAGCTVSIIEQNGIPCWTKEQPFVNPSWTPEQLAQLPLELIQFASCGIIFDDDVLLCTTLFSSCPIQWIADGFLLDYQLAFHTKGFIVSHTNYPDIEHVAQRLFILDVNWVLVFKDTTATILTPDHSHILSSKTSENAYTKTYADISTLWLMMQK